MSRHDWYRGTSWTAADREGFFARLNRSRDPYQKSQYLRIQALALAETKPEASLELLELVISEYPDRSQLASSWLQKAQCFCQLGNDPAAIASFEKAILEQREYPNLQTSVELEYSVFIVRRQLRSLYERAVQVLDESRFGVVFPISEYESSMVRAFVAKANGESQNAASWARLAIQAAAKTESPFRYHRKLGLVITTPEAEARELRALAAL